ncbi:MAG: hypothetical protein ACREB3_05340 [Burkholderiales bacterium]
MKLKPDQTLRIYSMGKRLAITAIFHDEAAANAYLAGHPDDVVVAMFEPYILLANKYDRGDGDGGGAAWA